MGRIGSLTRSLFHPTTHSHFFEWIFDSVSNDICQIEMNINKKSFFSINKETVDYSYASKLCVMHSLEIWSMSNMAFTCSEKAKQPCLQYLSHVRAPMKKPHTHAATRINVHSTNQIISVDVLCTYALCHVAHAKRFVNDASIQRNEKPVRADRYFFFLLAHNFSN